MKRLENKPVNKMTRNIIPNAQIMKTNRSEYTSRSGNSHS